MNTTPDSKPSRFLMLPAAAILLVAFFPLMSFGQARGGASEGSGKYTGPGSCASSACHGSVTPQNVNEVLQNEYSTWIVKDKHAQSYKALTGAVGERMAGILGLGKAELAPRCLGCHVLNPPTELRSRTFDVSEGVSCESCHGPASGWLGPHTERDWTHAKSVALGMVDTRDIVRRTEKCLSCHLGSEEKYVDHEMIAAGHPDIFFELDSFSAVMPRHWKEPPDGAPRGAERSVVRRARVDDRAGSAAARVDDAAGGARARKNLAGILRNAVLRVPPQPDSSGAELAAGARVCGATAGRSAMERFAVRRVSRCGASAGWRGCGAVGRSDHAADEIDEPAESRSRGVASAATNSARLADALVAKVQGAAYDPAATLRLLRKICDDADEISGEGEQSAAQAAMAIQSLFVAYDRDAKLQNSTECARRSARYFSSSKIPRLTIQREFSRQMQQVNALLR